MNSGKLLLLVAFLFCASFRPAIAQEYKPVLEEAVSAFFKTKDHAEQVAQANKLVLIAKRYDKEWAPAYYTALCKILLNYEAATGDKDALLDEADEWLSKAAENSDNNNEILQSEIYALKAMLANARIGVDPAKRWKKFGKIFEENLEKAKALNADNPRIYFLKGTSLFYTPKAFGGGKKRAAEYFERAKALFEKETKDSILTPHWGQETNAYYLSECNQEDQEKQ